MSRRAEPRRTGSVGSAGKAGRVTDWLAAAGPTLGRAYLPEVARHFRPVAAQRPPQGRVMGLGLVDVPAGCPSYHPGACKSTADGEVCPGHTSRE